MRSYAAALALVLLAAAAPARAQNASIPFMGAETPRGTHSIRELAPVAPAARTVDGATGDWTGVAPGFAGTLIRSHGELIYSDHLFDAHGADDGGDANALLRFDETQSVLPEAYRLEALMRNDPAGQVGAPSPEQLQYAMEYGDLGLQDRADLTELRLAPGSGGLHVLARTTTMLAASDATLVLLLDTAPGEESRPVGFGTGLTTRRAEYAVRITAAGVRVADLASGAVTDGGQVAVDPSGYANAIEAHVPLALPDSVAVAAATAAGDGPLANVAFRLDEPVREFFDKKQALALHSGSIDGFFADLDLPALRAGATERWVPGPGYHERTFESTPAVAAEKGADGMLQHYGVYLPSAYAPGERSPLQLWLHWRGGTAHSAGTTIPGMFRDLGERRDAIVVSPRGRGSSSWYVGRGYVDVEDVWADLHRTFSVDPRRRYVSGHSMGGWGTQLFTITHPDWFAGGLPASPPVTQGAWTGADFEGCDELQFDDYTPCYIQANGGDARAQHTLRMLDNLRHVPLAIYHGTFDELVPTTGVTMNVKRLIELGYRHRYYLFHTQEHFGPPVWDQWEEGGAYMHRFRAPRAPARVTFKRDMPFERAIETINSGGAEIGLDFDSAYWMSGLEPVDPQSGVARFDGRSSALRARPRLALPEAGAGGSPGQTGPYTMTGVRWARDPLAARERRRNAFSVELSGARAVSLDAKAMRLRVRRAIAGAVATDSPLTLRLSGGWRSAPRVKGAQASFAEGVLTLSLPAGEHALRITP